jgi:hypothetical protein
MAITGVGIRRDLVGPPPVRRKHTLLEVPGVLDQTERWLNGVNLLGYPEATPETWGLCSEGTFREKAEGEDRPQASFDPFVLYLPVTCSSLGWQDLAEMAVVTLDVTTSHGVEQVLAQGFDNAPLTNNPFFGDANLTILGGATESPAVALAYLEDAIAGTGRGGVIHAAPGTLAALNPALTYSDEGQLYTTGSGTPVVSGSGYIDTDPDGGSTPAADQDWMFATGPVRVYLGEITVPPIAEALDRSDNTVTFRAERPVLALWDTALQVGVLVDWD